LSHKQPDSLSGGGQLGKGSAPVVADFAHPRRYASHLINDVAAASELLNPFDARLMRCYPVSTRINSVANDDAGCSAPVEQVQIQDRLFS
jgi:hypothetical protein